MLWKVPEHLRHVRCYYSSERPIYFRRSVLNSSTSALRLLSRNTSLINATISERCRGTDGQTARYGVSHTPLMLEAKRHGMRCNELPYASGVSNCVTS